MARNIPSGDIFMIASSAPMMAPKKTVMAARASVTLTPLIRNTSQYLDMILMIFWITVLKVMLYSLSAGRGRPQGRPGSVAI